MKIGHRRRILWQIILSGPTRPVIASFLVLFVIMAVLLILFEPDIDNFGDAAWYCFVSCTTIGFGDFAAVSLLGRVITVILYLDAVLVIAIVTAVAVQFFTEVAKHRHNESTAMFLYQLEHLPELSKEELAEMSEKVKNLRKGKD